MCVSYERSVASCPLVFSIWPRQLLKNGQWDSVLQLRIFSVISAVCCVSLHQLWLLFYYTSLAVRENILQTNGSDIKDWWIVHHYVSMIVAVITLLWPKGPSYVLLSILRRCVACVFEFDRIFQASLLSAFDSVVDVVATYVHVCCLTFY
jgi:hypothetical protein